MKLIISENKINFLLNEITRKAIEEMNNDYSLFRKGLKSDADGNFFDMDSGMINVPDENGVDKYTFDPSTNILSHSKRGTIPLSKYHNIPTIQRYVKERYGNKMTQRLNNIKDEYCQVYSLAREQLNNNYDALLSKLFIKKRINIGTLRIFLPWMYKEYETRRENQRKVCVDSAKLAEVCNLEVLEKGTLFDDSPIQFKKFENVYEGIIDSLKLHEIAFRREFNKANGIQMDEFDENYSFGKIKDIDENNFN